MTERLNWIEDIHANFVFSKLYGAAIWRNNEKTVKINIWEKEEKLVNWYVQGEMTSGQLSAVVLDSEKPNRKNNNPNIFLCEKSVKLMNI